MSEHVVPLKMKNPMKLKWRPRARACAPLATECAAGRDRTAKEGEDPWQGVGGRPASGGASGERSEGEGREARRVGNEAASSSEVEGPTLEKRG
ncbi:hypothetical protein EYF80_031146 [Liparis tanakae]|uniref:Uncharacterized protein n=1 Tax=Liparis tanakae TaxID=230148 RepID=A0A4Z2H0N9_9TELE|nr:hypothetical protein EYF80_031146 [Liparis tanakae]